jgi:hypothetical protein
MKKLLLLYFLFSFFNSAFSQNPLVKQWDYRFGGTNKDWLSSFQRTFDGGYIIGGFSKSDSSGNKTQNSWGYSDYWIVKIDSAGNMQWDKDFGGGSTEKFYTLQQTTDGGYILEGLSNSGISGDKTQTSWGDNDYWIVKIDSLGTKKWDKRYGGTFADDFSFLHKPVMADIFSEELPFPASVETKQKIYGVAKIIGL